MSSSSEIAIRVNNLGKKYRLGLTHRGTLRESLHGLGRRLLRRNGNKSLAPGTTHLRADSPLASDTSNQKPTRDFWALQDVSFEVKRGEVLGVIGRNGAGKSTLLKILSRITNPTEGRAEIGGRVASLLEVGTGFHPELTGRENVYLNGAILGMTKREISRKFDEIVDFSGVEKFIDTPVKRYSSGMHVRLGFGVAAHLEPEILIVDEVLAVGDAEFQRKCLGKIENVAAHGRTVLFVSHNMGSVQKLCSRGLMLEDGRVTADGTSREVVHRYLASFGTAAEGNADLRNHPGRGADMKPVIQSLRIVSPDSECDAPAHLTTGNNVTFEITFDAGDLRFDFAAIGICSDSGERLCTIMTPQARPFERSISGRGTIRIELQSLPLAEGNYLLMVAVGQTTPIRNLDYIEGALRIEVRLGDYFPGAQMYSPGQGVFVQRSDWSIRRVTDDLIKTSINT